MTIVAENLGKRFNREWIFKNLSYSFESGEVYAITGPNGSGKSTLMQVIWGQMPPSAGTIAYSEGGKNIPGEDVYQHLSIAAPYMDLIDEFTLTEMVDFHFKFKRLAIGISKNEVIERMELTASRNKFISNFSSGMRQRLKLALAFFSDTPILFLDEPTTNLDQKAVAWYRTNLASVKARLVFIASNQEHEYPETALQLNMSDYKLPVTNKAG